MQSNGTTPQFLISSLSCSTISLFVLGWGAAALLSSRLHHVWARWLLFFGGTLGLTSMGLPIMWF